jgi:hypothetical protein
LGPRPRGSGPVRDNHRMFLAHIPINHHLRPLYRALSALIGLYLVGFGIAGIVQAGDLDATAQRDLPRVLGQTVNTAGSVVALVIGAVVVIATVLGRNVDHLVNFYAGMVMMLVALAMLAFARTDANILGFALTNVIVWFVLASVVSTAGLYTKVGPESEPVPAHA